MKEKLVHSTETISSLQLTLTAALLFILMPPDLGAAFDTISRPLLLNTPSSIGLALSSLDWVRSCLTARAQVAKRSKPSSVTTGVPQGSAVVPLIFIMNLPPLCKFNFIFHCFADGTLLFLLRRPMSSPA